MGLCVQGQGGQTTPKAHHRHHGAPAACPKVLPLQQTRRTIQPSTGGVPVEIEVLLTKLCLEFLCFLRPRLAPCVKQSLDTKWFQTPSNGLAWRQGVRVSACSQSLRGQGSAQQLQRAGAPGGRVGVGRPFPTLTTPATLYPAPCQPTLPSGVRVIVLQGSEGSTTAPVWL